MTDPRANLTRLGIQLPKAPAPVASYHPWARTNDLVMTAGQIAMRPDKSFVATGIVGSEVDLQTAQECARQCAINIIAQLDAAVGLESIDQIVKLVVFVASAPDFTDHHLVANAASDLMGEVFGERGRHARSAVGVAALPLGSPVEIEAIARVRA